MAKQCAVTGKTSRMGGSYSNRVRATQFNPTPKRRRHINLQKKKVYIPELKKSISLLLSTKGLKTLAKNGPYKTLKDAGLL